MRVSNGGAAGDLWQGFWPDMVCVLAPFLPSLLRALWLQSGHRIRGLSCAYAQEVALEALLQWNGSSSGAEHMGPGMLVIPSRDGAENSSGRSSTGAGDSSRGLIVSMMQRMLQMIKACDHTNLMLRLWPALFPHDVFWVPRHHLQMSKDAIVSIEQSRLALAQRFDPAFTSVVIIR